MLIFDRLSVSGNSGGFTAVDPFDGDVNPHFVNPPYDLERRTVLRHGVSIITSRDVSRRQRLAQALGKFLRLFYHRLIRGITVESAHGDAANRPFVLFQVQVRERRGRLGLEF